jgi:glyoxylase-like metal-dependent hydrolase (beta-lactamase superfamily II)
MTYTKPARPLQTLPVCGAARPTSRNQWQAWSRREVPDVEEVRPGVWSIPVPIPAHPMRYTLCYAFVGEGEVLVIDPGWASLEGWSALAAGLHQAGAGPETVTGIVVTHHHPDHLGLAQRLIDASAAWLAAGDGEQPHLVPQGLEAARRKLRGWGVPNDLLDSIAPDAAALDRLRLLAAPDFWLRDGDLLRVAGVELRVIATPGHSSGHIALHDEKRSLLFTGDHVLPRISPNVPLDPDGLSDPLGAYLDSLVRVRIDDDAEICPAHEYRFASIADRCATLEAHTAARSEEVLRVVEERASTTVWEVARHLTWSRGWDALNGVSMRLALAETASHLQYVAVASGRPPIRLQSEQLRDPLHAAGAPIRHEEE